LVSRGMSVRGSDGDRSLRATDEEVTRAFRVYAGEVS
jgi:hypothetical protein